MLRRWVGVFAGVCLLGLVFAGSALASFGLSEFDVTFTNQDGSADVLAGSHPFAMTTSFHVISEPGTEGGQVTEQQIKDLLVSQVPGFVGDPVAIPRCSEAEFLTEAGNLKAEAIPDCPDSTAIGVATLLLANEKVAAAIHVPVYNLVPAPGVAATIGFWAGGVPVPIELGVKDTQPYDVVGGPTNTSQLVEVISAKLTLWGVPAAPAHDPYRGRCLNGGTGGSYGNCAAGVPEAPFLTLPTSCEGPVSTLWSVDSWEHPGRRLRSTEADLSDPAWVSGSVLTNNAGEPPASQGFLGCSGLAFEPVISAQPTSTSASSPTGLVFSLDFNNEGLTSPSGVSQSDIKKVTVTLPEQVSVNPALAEGLSACSEADLAKETIGGAPGEGCPEGSKIGTVEVETPLLEQILKGSLYLATPYQNPFGSLIGLYVVVKNPETGVLLKLPGQVTPNAVTGQLTSVFDDLPRLPFSHFRLKFRQGQRSPLVTPAVCGTYTTRADLVPWANPETVLHDTATFETTTGIAGGPCPVGGVPGFHPTLSGGSESNQAGAYSPFGIEINRQDGEQEITGIATQLPAGLTGNLTGIPFCTPGEIAAAEAQTGVQAEASPACPAASQIGHSLVGVGVGAVLSYTPGRLYLAGPYQGAPFSVVDVTAAKVGPFDLGTVVVHLPLRINPVTAQVSIPTGPADQIPHIVKGIVVHVRNIRVYVDRKDFMRNPTSCTPSTLSATITGSGANFTSPADDQPVNVSDRYQAAGCRGLPFKPVFKVLTHAKHTRKTGAYLHVLMESNIAQAGIKEVHVELPNALPSELKTLQHACTEAQFATNPAGCPPESVVGQAEVNTPILPVPLKGPAIFVSHGGAKFPELVLLIQGYGVTIQLNGETFISKKGITSSTFKAVPDQPFTRFSLILPAKEYSALAGNGNFCTRTIVKRKRIKVHRHGHVLHRKGHVVHKTIKTHRKTRRKLTMPTRIVAQSGKTIERNTPITVTGCGKHKAKGARHHKHKHHAKHHHGKHAHAKHAHSNRRHAK